MSCFFSKRVRYCWAAGWSLRHNTAAAEKAHVRWALPIVAPEVPRRWPADALRTCHQAARGEESLSPGEAVDIMDVIEPHEAEKLADARHGWQQREGVGVVVPGGLEEAEFDVAKERIVRGDERQIDLDALVHGGIGTAFGNAVTVGLGGDLCAHGREVLLALGMLHMGQECSTLARQRHTAPEHITSRAHLGGRARGLWEHTAAQELGNLLGIARVIFGLPAMDGFHREGMTEDERDALVGTPVSEPVPGEQALDGHDETRSRRGNKLSGRPPGRFAWCGCTRTSPPWSRMQTYMVRACRSMPQ